MTQTQHDDAQAFTARILGALFYYGPDSEAAAPLVNAFREGSWSAQWPYEVDETLKSAFSHESEESLPQAFQRLFVGPYALPAPPWGSVWLDRENVLFGESTLALRQWMRDNGIHFSAVQNEPEDHIGTLLMLGAWLRENGRYSEWEQLLAWHVLPWSGRFLTVFIEQAGHPFYQALGQLTQDTLAHWQSPLLIPVAEKPCYR